MKIAVIGAGSIGGLVGARLAMAGEEVASCAASKAIVSRWVNWTAAPASV